MSGFVLFFFKERSYFFSTSGSIIALGSNQNTNTQGVVLGVRYLVQAPQLWIVLQGQARKP